jgi:hypothetical protein
MTDPALSPNLYIAVETFLAVHDGHDEWIKAGDIAKPNSWPVVAHPGSFRPLVVRWKDPRRRRTPTWLLLQRGSQRASRRRRSHTA